MAALIVLSLLRAGLSLEVSGCPDDAATLGRLVVLDWPRPPPAARAAIVCEARRWQLTLSAPGYQTLFEQLELPRLTGEALTRVLALIVAERGRSLAVETAPPPAEPGPDETAPGEPGARRAPLVAQAATTTTAEVEPPPPASPLKGALFGAQGTRLLRVSVVGAAQTPVQVGPWRFGPELKVQLGPVVLGVASSVGHVSQGGYDLSAWTVTFEPELSAACLTGHRWQVCGGPRGIVGYGSISATLQPGVTGFVTKAPVSGPVLGGAAAASFSVALTDWLAVDVDGRLGWQWAVYGSNTGVPVASLGGAFGAVGVGLAGAWGNR